MGSRRTSPRLPGPVGDSADGDSAIPRIGAVTAARLLREHGPSERCTPQVLGEGAGGGAALLATMRTDADLFTDVDELRWRGPPSELPASAERLGIRGS